MNEQYKTPKDPGNPGCITAPIMIVGMFLAGPLAAIFTYQLVVGEVEATSEILRFIAIGWAIYLLGMWFASGLETKKDTPPYTDRFTGFLVMAIGWLGITVGGFGTYYFVMSVLFPGPGSRSEIPQEIVRDGLLAIALLTATILMIYRSNAQTSRVSTPRFPFGQYPETWEDIRRTVLKRDDYRCANCRSTENLHVHHIVPLSLGGSNELSNLKTLCKGCHTRLHPHMRD